MSSASEPLQRKPLNVRFESLIDLTIHEARLSSAGLLQCDPIARVDLVTVRRVITDGKPTVSFSAFALGKTTPKMFTATPRFNETMTFTVTDTSALATVASHSRGAGAQDGVEDSVVITFEDSTSRQFLGQAYCPFSPHSPSMTSSASPVRLMLQPRNLLDPMDPLFLEDSESLAAQGLDDFGFVTISWKVALLPLGGALDVAPAPKRSSTSTTGAPAPEPGTAAPAVPAGDASASPTPIPPPTSDATAKTGEAPSPSPSEVKMPIGITVKAVWLVTAHYGRDHVTQYHTSVEFGDGKRFRLVDGKPLFLTLRDTADLRACIFYCSALNVPQPDKSRDIAVVIPLPPLTSQRVLDRDIHWAAPVRSGWGEDYGVLVSTVRLSTRPVEGNVPECPSNGTCLMINDPLHQEEFTHAALDYRRPPPNAPHGAYQTLFWESEDHIRRSIERQRRRELVLVAQPSDEHVRHLFDVLMGRCELDASVAGIASNFFQCSSTDLVALQLKELMVAFAFNSRSLSVLDAARFLFIAFRSDVEDAITAEELHYMIQHCLLEKTLDMPEKELRRWVTDVIGHRVKVIQYSDFSKYFLQNYGFWYLLGVPITMDRATSSEPLPHLAQVGARAAGSGALQPTSFYRDPATQSDLAGEVPGTTLGGWSSQREAPRTPHPASDAAPDTGAGGARPAGASSTRNVQFQLEMTPAAASGGTEAVQQSPWRTFIIRMEDNPQKAFSVTAHCKDKIRDVMKMVEESTNIKADCQQWKLNRENLLEPQCLVGNTTLGIEPSLKPSSSAAAAAAAGAGVGAPPTSAEVWVSEMEEVVTIQFVYKDKKKRWEQRIPTREKVLQIRAAVQRQTLLPLSRCMLRLTRNGRTTALQDRHPFSYYSPQPNDTIEVTQEAY